MTRTRETARLTRRGWLGRVAAASLGLAFEPFDALSGVFGGPSRRPSAEIAGSTRRGDPRILLSANENPYGPPPSAVRAMRAALERGNRYPRDPELDALVEAIADREGLTPDHVVLGAGSGAILCWCGAAFAADPGAELVAADPTYSQLLRYAERFGARVHRIPLDGSQTHDLERMAARTTSAVRVVYVCNPNNPSGTIVDGERLEDFCRTVSRRALVFVDEAYHEYVEDPAHRSMVSLVAAGENVVVSRTFSKIYGLAGMRIGYGLARPDVAARIRRLDTGSIGTVAVASARAAYRAERFLEESRRRNRVARTRLCDALADVGFPCAESHANFVWARTGERRDLPVLLDREGIRIRWVPRPVDGAWTRISVGTEEEVRDLVSTLRRVLGQ